MSGKPTDKKKLLDKIKKFVKDNPSAIQISDVNAAICSKDTFYKYFPVGSEAHTEIVDMLEDNRISMKMRIRDRLYELNQSAGLIALYKLIGTEEERVALSNIKVEQKNTPSGQTETITLKFG